MVFGECKEGFLRNLHVLAYISCLIWEDTSKLDPIYSWGYPLFGENPHTFLHALNSPDQVAACCPMVLSKTYALRFPSRGSKFANIGVLGPAYYPQWFLVPRSTWAHLGQ